MRFESFQLIDRIGELNLSNRTIRTEATVPLTSAIFEGHFPGYPLMPGVLLLEAMAQTSGWLIIGLTQFERMPFLTSFKEAKLRSFVTPGQALALSASIVHEGSGYAITKAEAKVDGKVVCNAEITFRMLNFPNPEFLAGMKKAAATIAFPMETLADG